MLIRTQLMLDEQLKRDLAELSMLTGQSMSEITRDVMIHGIAQKKKKVKKKLNKKTQDSYTALAKLIEHATRGPGDSEYDKYAYDL